MTNQYRCGSVALIGEPNAGKSSLLNVLVGCPVTITAAMAGTTRAAIRGILNTRNAQIIFIDTPGMQPATNLLERKMNREISGAVKTADVLCFLIDVNQVTPKVIEKLSNYENFGVPVILVLTKIDSAQPQKIFQALDNLKHLTFIKDFIPVSAHKKIGLDDLIQEIETYLPIGKAIYDRDTYTDTTERNMAEEIIREAVINHVHDEVPAGVKVNITKYLINQRTIEIDADIVCDKTNHKKIIIGNQGKMIHAIGIAARKKLEQVLGQHVMLHTFVMVREGWRNRENLLKD